MSINPGPTLAGAPPEPASPVTSATDDGPASWWAFVVRGLLAIVFGVMTFTYPAMALLSLALLFGGYALAEGVLVILASFQTMSGPEQSRRWWMLLLHGVVSVAAGLVAIVVPGLTAIAVAAVIALRALATGVLELVAAVELRKEVEGEWLLVLSGALSIVFGAFVLLFPGAGALALLLWVGAYAALFGALLVSLGLEVRGYRRARASGRSPTLAARHRAPRAPRRHSTDRRTHRTRGETP